MMKSISVLLFAVATLLTTEANAWCVKNATLAEAKATLTVEHLNTAKLKDKKATISSLSSGETMCDPVLAAGASPTGDNPIMLRVQIIVESGVAGCMDKKAKACIKVCANGGKKSATLALKGKNVAQVSRNPSGEFLIDVSGSAASASEQKRFFCQ
jgi:hypothetical protein